MNLDFRITSSCFKYASFYTFYVKRIGFPLQGKRAVVIYNRACPHS